MCDFVCIPFDKLRNTAVTKEHDNAWAKRPADRLNLPVEARGVCAQR